MQPSHFLSSEKRAGVEALKRIFDMLEKRNSVGAYATDLAHALWTKEFNTNDQQDAPVS